MDHIGIDPMYHIGILLAVLALLGGFVAFKLRAPKSAGKNASLPTAEALAVPVKNLVPKQATDLKSNNPTSARAAATSDKPTAQGVLRIVDESGSISDQFKPYSANTKFTRREPINTSKSTGSVQSTSTPKSTVVDKPTVQRKPEARLTLSARFRTSRAVKAENRKITLEVNQTSNPIPLEAEGWLSIDSPVSGSFVSADGLAIRSIHPKSTSVALPKGSAPTQVRIKRTVNGGIDLLTITVDPQPVGSQA